MTFKLAVVAGAISAIFAAGPASAADVVRTGAPTAIIAQTITVPGDYQTVYLSGVLPDLPKPPEAPADAEAQALSAFTKIGAILKEQGLSEADVVSMTIYMASLDGSPMDFAGMMNSYKKFYGTATQPNKPTRSTVQVVRLANPSALIEVEVTAVRKPR